MNFNNFAANFASSFNEHFSDSAVVASLSRGLLVLAAGGKEILIDGTGSVIGASAMSENHGSVMDVIL